MPFIDNLEKLGISATLRTIDSSQYQKRIESFDFDMVVFTFSQSLSPGNEQRNFWSSGAADTNGSRNIIGIKNDVIDLLIENLINAKNREDLITITKALDRVLLWNYYVSLNGIFRLIESYIGICLINLSKSLNILLVLILGGLIKINLILLILKDQQTNKLKTLYK